MAGFFNERRKQTMKIRISKIVIATFLGVGLMWLGLRLTSADASLQGEFDLFAANCASFERARAEVVIYGVSGPPLGYILNLRSDGWLVADDVFGGLRRTTWNGDVVRDHWLGLEEPTTRDGPESLILAGLWAECRAGFSNTT
jgi:hypothetical protein